MLLMIGLLMLKFATSFVWGREYGYVEGISYLIRAIMEKLPESQLKTLST
ncbi:hypothetical protein GCM10028818_22690 [Spirosoma horti]